jgi:hypothetical protein
MLDKLKREGLGRVVERQRRLFNRNGHGSVEEEEQLGCQCEAVGCEEMLLKL